MRRKADEFEPYCGYEGGGAMIPYGLPTRFQSSVEDLVSGAVDELMNSVSGR